jgi:hypothetical protein
MHREGDVGTFALVAERPFVMRGSFAGGTLVLHADGEPAKQWSDGLSLWYENGSYVRSTFEHVLPRATVTYVLIDGAYVRQPCRRDEEAAARWADETMRHEPDSRRFNDAEQQMLIWAGDR